MSRSIATTVSIVLLLAAEVRADDIDEPTGVCVRDARYFTCPDGTTIDACDDCGDDSSGGGDNGEAGKGMIKAVGMLIGVAIFVPGVVLSPAVAIELWFGKGEDILGDKAKAREAHATFLQEQRDTEAAGERFIAAQIALDAAERNGELRDAIGSTTLPTKRALPPTKGPPWWTKMPRLVPNLDIACRTAAIEFPFHLNPDDPIATFTNVADMQTRCFDRIENGVDPVRPVNGACPPATRVCLHLMRNGSPACCPQGHSVFNEVDEKCYRDTDYRKADKDEARRFLGGEYCPASSR